MTNPQFIVFVGPMFSSKTTKLLTSLERYKYQKKSVVVFKPSIEKRYHNSSIVSHGGWETPATTVKSGDEMLAALHELEKLPDIVAVDEAFMIEGVAETLTWLFRKGISIVVSTLDMSATGKPFKEVKDILPWATRVEKCAAVCVECGADAQYTHKKQVNDDEIEVGGSELYEPRCFEHHIFVNFSTGM